MLGSFFHSLRRRLRPTGSPVTHSPWIHQLNRQRPPETLTSDVTTDIAIVGAGIAGICTTYFTLKNTPHRVILIEGDKVAHGATGHNAGQMVSYFERQVAGLVKEFGLEQTAAAQNAIDSAWDLIDEMYQDTQLSTPFSQFTGYAGCQDLEEIILHLENSLICRQAGLNTERMLIAEDAAILNQIPTIYQEYYSLVPHKDILSLLETHNDRYIAAIAARKGCMNSALFCEDLLRHMLLKYGDRLTLFENSPMTQVDLAQDQAVLHILDHQVTAKKVILCTNGFEHFTINNTTGPDIDAKFHHLVRGTIGYMAGYLEPDRHSPIAISYLPDKSLTDNKRFDENPYFYLTRRSFELGEGQRYNLICIGGPESKLDDSNNYSKSHPYPNEAQKVIDEFLHDTYAFAPKGKINYTYKWHGLMGYTPNGVRCIGPEPLNNALLYNLGCNGVGILPSIYGGKKISQFLNGEQLPASIFDPQASF